MQHMLDSTQPKSDRLQESHEYTISIVEGSGNLLIANVTHVKFQRSTFLRLSLSRFPDPANSHAMKISRISGKKFSWYLEGSIT